MLGRFKKAAKDGALLLFYFDEAGCSGSPPTQRSWSKVGYPHRIAPAAHCRRMFWAPWSSARENLFSRWRQRLCALKPSAIFCEKSRSRAGHRSTVVVLDNARIHHAIPEKVELEWLFKRQMLLWFLPTHSPELNLIEIVWRQAKHHWRAFKTWSKETIEQEIVTVLGSYRLHPISFSSELNRRIRK